MTPAKMKVCFSFFPYSGNGSVSSEHPSIRDWFARSVREARADERVSEIESRDYCDTPVTMVRNKSVRDAIKAGGDVLICCDSDQHPDLYLGHDPLAKPFFQSSFDFAYQQRMKGQPVIVGAPYCGPPPNELVYVFKWTSLQSDHPNVDMRMEMFSRDEAANRAGIEAVAALPTGLIMFDLQVFQYLEPPYFYYEYTDKFESEKASTEDVTCTRDISLHGHLEAGYWPVHCNWDAWAGHYKPKCVGKPKILTHDQVSENFQKAAQRKQSSKERLTFVRNGDLANLGICQ